MLSKQLKLVHSRKTFLQKLPALANIGSTRKEGEGVHLWLERTPTLLSVLAFITIAIGGLVEIVPTLSLKQSVPTITAVKPYTPLELEGRDLYIREGCNSCHSQMIRPFRDEVVRFEGKTDSIPKRENSYTTDHSYGDLKRTGPDLHREGGRNPDSWHFKHMYNPRITSAGSIMPRFPWLITNKLDKTQMVDKMKLMKNAFGVPYTKAQIDSANQWADNQSKAIVHRIYAEATDVKDQMVKEKTAKGSAYVPLEQREIVAMIAYLQRLGTDIKTTQVQTASVE